MKKTPSVSYYHKQINSLIKNKYKYILTGIIVIVAISTLTILQFRNKNILGVFTFDSSEDSPIAISSKTDEIKNVAVSKSIDYISPGISNDERRVTNSSLSRPEENGQISAIASGKVSYKEDTYVVKPGDSLASIAEQVYGDVNAWIRIAKANNIANPNDVEVGMTLNIPR